jgi:predicted O-methyltransferase YrrM
MEKLVAEINNLLGEIDFAEELAKYKLPDNIRHCFLSDPYYKALAAYCRLRGPKRVLEIGTCSGASAVALAKYAESVLTVDVDLSTLVDPNINGGRIEICEIGPLDCLNLDFANFDFIFVDIDHTGQMERKIHEKLQKEYLGIVFWDDVILNQGMSDFWDSIREEKVITPWHFSGFGVVNYAHVL